MNNQPFFLLMGMIFFVMVAGFLVAMGFLVYASIELRKAAISLKAFLKVAEEKIPPLIAETEQTLKSLRRVSDDVAIVTENVGNVSTALREITENVRVASLIVTDLREGASLRFMGVKAGIRAAMHALGQEIKKKSF